MPDLPSVTQSAGLLSINSMALHKMATWRQAAVMRRHWRSLQDAWTECQLVSNVFYIILGITDSKTNRTRAPLTASTSRLFQTEGMRGGLFYFDKPISLPHPITTRIVPIPLGPSQCHYTKSLFHNNSYESVYGLARLHTNLHSRRQYEGIMWLVLRSDKSNNVDFHNQIRYFTIKLLPNCPHEAGYTPF